MSEHDFAMERRLRALDPGLHRRFTDAVFALQHILSNYQLIFPEYTDHTELHSLTVIDFCNRLMGRQIEQLNADELYVLLLGCYFHDTGMGLSRRDFEAFSKEIDFGDWFDTHSPDNLPEVIRAFHNEFSGCFIRKYAEFFELPSEAHTYAVIEISRGHRKTNLQDEASYSVALPVPGGNTICLPYLAALIRLSDEIDITAARNSPLLYDVATVVDPKQVLERRKHLAVRDLRISEEAFTILVETEDPALLENIRVMAGKMQKTLDDCRNAVVGRTPYVITQERIVLERV